jgi:ubiquitin conjugation factor E4 B
MEDPVKLPSSNIIVDRNTIDKHLLSDPTDPFNRSKLSKEMLIPCDELKSKINEYKKAKENK